MPRATSHLVLPALSICAVALGGCGSTGTEPPRSEPVSPAALGQRAAHTATDLGDGSVLVAGGCDVDGCSTASASAMLVSAAGVRATAPLRQARDAHTATALPDRRVLVAGGFAGEGEGALASAEAYDRETDRWRTVGALALGRGGHAAAELGDGSVLVAGGWVRSRTYTASTEIFDPARSTFVAGPDLPRAVDGLAAAPLPDGGVLVTGGQVRPGVGTASAAVVDATGSRIREVGPMRRVRFKHTMVALPSGKVLVIGGTRDDRTLLRSTEIYDPETQRFTAGPRMTAGRYKLSGSAVVLPDGRVVVAGGGRGVEIIDLAAGTSVAVKAAPASPSSFSTVSLVGSTLRVVGGYDDKIRLTGLDLRIPLARLG